MNSTFRRGFRFKTFGLAPSIIIFMSKITNFIVYVADGLEGVYDKFHLIMLLSDKGS